MARTMLDVLGDPFWALRAQWVARFWWLDATALIIGTVAVVLHWLSEAGALPVYALSSQAALMIVVLSYFIDRLVSLRWQEVVQRRLSSIGLDAEGFKLLLTPRPLAGEPQKSRRASLLALASVPVIVACFLLDLSACLYFLVT